MPLSASSLCENACMDFIILLHLYCVPMCREYNITWELAVLVKYTQCTFRNSNIRSGNLKCSSDKTFRISLLGALLLNAAIKQPVM